MVIRRCALAVLAASAVLVTAGPAAARPAVADDVGGNVLVSWSIPKVPAGGLTDITFPITVEPDTAHQDGTYFAQQFDFLNASDIGYTGLQPRPDLNGHHRLHAVFSSFVAGSTTTDPDCHDGADNGPGVSCATEFNGVYGRTYALTVQRVGPDTWLGTVTDTLTGRRRHVGSYTLPAGSGNLGGSEVGFVEYYLGSPSCAVLPRIDVFFGGPTSTTRGGLRGTTRAQYEYSECIGQADYQARNVGRGVHVTRGWPPTG